MAEPTKADVLRIMADAMWDVRSAPPGTANAGCKGLAEAALSALAARGLDPVELRGRGKDIVEGWDCWQVDTYGRCQSVPGDAIEEMRATLAKWEDRT